MAGSSGSWRLKWKQRKIYKREWKKSHEYDIKQDERMDPEKLAGIAGVGENNPYKPFELNRRTSRPTQKYKW